VVTAHDYPAGNFSRLPYPLIRLTDEPVVGVPGWRCTFPACRARRPRAEGTEVIPMAVLRTSASDGADGPVLVLSGEADTTTAPLLREMLATQLDSGARLVTVDASGLSFMDSASLRVLVMAARTLQGRHGTLVLARPQPLVARMLEITGADRLLEVREW
jgi:anti-sigma B factor antagonist